MEQYNKELQNIISFIDTNEELVNSALHLTAISIMKTINEFNTFENNLTILISNYYRISYSPELDFRIDVLNAGFLSYGQKLKILEIILDKCEYCKNISEGPIAKCLAPLKTIGDLRNDIVHSIYGIDPEKAFDESPKLIIYTNGRKISKKDLLKTFDDFEKYLNESNVEINNIVKYLDGTGARHA